MRVSLNWLKDFLTEGEWCQSPELLAERLVLAGLEVDEIEYLGKGLEGVVSARLQGVEKHPDADRLTVCQVYDGNSVYQVVCGAKNHKAGDVVALARVGAELPNGLKIKKTKLRGVDSSGMLCSEEELGISKSSDGILILSQETPLGESVKTLLGLDDVMLDISLTANRGDCLSHIGVAREIAAIYGLKVKEPFRPGAVKEDPSKPIDYYASVANEVPELCWDYEARVMLDVQIKESPVWLKNRLIRAGLRPINNIVDVTNYVLLELGQPLHAFDLDKLSGSETKKKILVRRARENEKFVALDETELELSGREVVITDGSVPVALAGVIGGFESAVSFETKRILIESARFSPVSVRKTATHHKKSTDSSYRFERGVDPRGVRRALNRAAELMLQVSGGSLCSGILRKEGNAEDVRPILLSITSIGELLGYSVPKERVVDLLRGLGCDIAAVGGSADDRIQVAPPSWRPDITRQVDLIEEVARLNGYEKIPVKLPAITSETKSQLVKRADALFQLKQHARRILSDFGYRDLLSFAFCSPNDFSLLGLNLEESPRIQNPISEDLSQLKTSLVLGLLKNAAYNLSQMNHNLDQLKTFELRNCFYKCEDSETGVREVLKLALLASGHRLKKNWASASTPLDFFDLKGDLESFLIQFGANPRLVQNLEYRSEAIPPFLHPGISCTLWDKELGQIGFMGKLHPEKSKSLEVDENTYLVEVDFLKLGALCQAVSYEALNRFPRVSRDVALIVSDSVMARELIETALGAGGEFLSGVDVFDVYQGRGVPSGKKSVALSFIYESSERTLKDEEVQKSFLAIIEAEQKKWNAELR